MVFASRHRASRISPGRILPRRAAPPNAGSSCVSAALNNTATAAAVLRRTDACCWRRAVAATDIFGPLPLGARGMGGGGERERSFGRLRAAVAAAVAAAAAVTAAVAVDSAGGRGAKCEYAEGTKFTDVYYLAANAPPLGVGESWVDNHGCLGSAVLVVCCLVWWSVLLADGDGERDSWRCFSREMDDARQNTGTWSILLLVHTTQKLHRAKSWRACSCDRFLFCIPSTLLRRARVLCDVPSM